MKRFPIHPMRALTALLLSQVAAVALAADVTVSAAASLRDAFTDIAREYEKGQPETRVLLNFGASGQLLQQISRGAPVDVFAAADQETMDRAQKQNLLMPGTRADFARNELVLAVSLDARTAPQALPDLKADTVSRIALGNPESVPAGRYAKVALDGVSLWEPLKPKFVYTQNVRQALDYLVRGEVDAGFVYLTDAALMPDRVRVAARVSGTGEILYPIAVVKGGGNARAGERFVEFVRQPAAQKILAKYRFLRP